MRTAVGRLSVYLQLGRVSNLPTVWSNVLAGVVLGGGTVGPRSLGVLLLALSLVYVGGMFLNDAFDREVDARERPERPIPAGLVGATEVFLVGFGMLGVAVGMVAWEAREAGVGDGLLPLWAALGLAATVVLYDVWHKGNPASPVVMGACRMGVYVTAAAAATGSVERPVLRGALLLLCYLVGLTYAAKQERRDRVEHHWPLAFLALPFLVTVSSARQEPTAAVLFAGLLGWAASRVGLLLRRPPQVGRAVVGLIAGISLLDALLVAEAGRPGLAVLAALGFPATLWLQRWVRGT